MAHLLCPTFRKAVISGVIVARILAVTGRALVSDQQKVACARRHVHVAQKRATKTVQNPKVLSWRRVELIFYIVMFLAISSFVLI